MRKIIIVSFLFALVLFSCTPIVESSNANQYPIAYIDGISPTSAVAGTSIHFAGHGVDRDGSVVGYEWRSNIDGIISNKAAFDYTGLSLGKHAMYFRVQDNRDYWSKEEYQFVEIIPGYTTKPQVNEFKLTPERIRKGESSVLKWDISGATKIAITPDIGDVMSSGSRIIYPGVDTTYTLAAINEIGSTVVSTHITVAADQTRVIDVYGINNESGAVRFDHQVSNNAIAGIQGAGLVWQSFLSFDISMIPAGAVIKSTSLDLTNHYVVGSPFGILGKMGIINHQYGELDNNLYVGTFPMVTLHVASTEPLQPYVLSTITDSVQQLVSKGSQRFQIRIQFERYHYYADGPSNYVHFYPDKTKVSVTYEVP